MTGGNFFESIVAMLSNLLLNHDIIPTILI